MRDRIELWAFYRDLSAEHQQALRRRMRILKTLWVCMFGVLFVLAVFWHSLWMFGAFVALMMVFMADRLATLWRFRRTSQRDLDLKWGKRGRDLRT